MAFQDTKTNPEQKILYNIYALFGVAIALSVVPMLSAAIICLLFFTVLLIAAYFIRKREDEHSLVHNHMVFIIRSLWIGALMSLITTVCASFYMLQEIDYVAFNPCAETLAGKSLEEVEAMAYMEFYGYAKPCIDAFIQSNYNTLMISVAIAAGPPLLYIAFRFVKGVSRAVKGYRLADVKSWF
ncbi:MAG: hypothetical protein AB8B83_05700 [Bdellovibrionales bacterium]